MVRDHSEILQPLRKSREDLLPKGDYQTGHKDTESEHGEK